MYPDYSETGIAYAHDNQRVWERRILSLDVYEERVHFYGIDGLRLTSQGYGETRPVDPRHTQEAYKINRRVAFSIKQRD